MSIELILHLFKHKTDVSVLNVRDQFKKYFIFFRTFTYGVGQPIRNGFSPIVVLVK